MTGGSDAAERQNVTNRRILIKRNGVQSYMELEDYLPGVVACQIDSSYDMEALKCQAVIARTYLYRRMDGRMEIHEEELDLEYLGQHQGLLGGQAEAVVRRLERCGQAVGETKGVVMKYDDRYILPLFHHMNGGRTRTGREEFPYLQSVESVWDARQEECQQTLEWEAGQFVRLISQIDGEANVDASQLPQQIQTVERDDAGYMLQVKIGSRVFSGDDIWLGLGLPSACFSLEAADGKVRAWVRGNGHGYGLSQTGADGMAKEGWNYENILNHYYKNIVLVSE